MHEDIIARGRQCSLRAVRSDDAGAFYEWYINPEVQRHLANPWWNPSIDFETYQLHRFTQYLQAGPQSGVFTICHADGRPIGLVNYFDREADSCEIGIIIGDITQWRKGYAREALSLLLSYIIEDFKIHRVRARILKVNIPSQRLFEKVGFVRTGAGKEDGYEFLYYEFQDQQNSGSS